MTYLKTLARAAGLGLCVAALSGSALADPGKGNGNGPESTPPGQEKKAETPAAAAPAPQAAHGQEQKADNQAKQAEKKAAPKPTAKPTASKSTAAKAAAPGQAKKAEKQAEKSERKADKAASKAATSTSRGQSDNAHHHVIVCHRTGSESNPYVVINIPFTAWTNAHSDTTGSHPDKNGRHDIMLKDPASGPGSKDGFTKADCVAPAGPAPFAPVTPEQKDEKKQECPTTITTTEQVLVGIWHATGATKDGERKFVLISPSEKSAHWDKHADDRPHFETRTFTRTVSGENCEQLSVNPPSNPTVTVQQPLPVVQGQPAGVTPAIGAVGTLPAQAAAPVGGVAGAVSPAAEEEKPAGGVLGAIASAPEAVAETAVSGELPFTGIPLWIAALIGGALLATGLVLRRTTS